MTIGTGIIVIAVLWIFALILCLFLVMSNKSGHKWIIIAVLLVIGAITLILIFTPLRRKNESTLVLQDAYDNVLWARIILIILMILTLFYEFCLFVAYSMFPRHYAKPLEYSLVK